MDKKAEVEKELEKLRKKIDVVDREMVALLAERQTVVEEIVSVKKAYNMPVIHPAREENLISDRRTRARASGLDPEYVEELFRCIMRQSRKEQGVRMADAGVRSGSSVLIVGGEGEMGAYFRAWFERSGYQVDILGKNSWERASQLCAGRDLAMISVPIDVTCRVIADLAPHLPQECLLADITSIKAEPLAAMLRHHRGPVVGLHPLFGPTTSTLDKQIVVATHGRDPDSCRWLLDQLAAWGAIVVPAEAEEHDQTMDIVQTLRHFATFCFGQFLMHRGIDLHRTLDFSSPIYRLELGMVGRLFAQDPALYAEIVFATPQRRELLKEYLASLNRNLEMVENSEKDVFTREFRKVAEWFGPFGEQALRESSFLIDKLIERF
jgi:chorismate mutase/prephenate dehydrogenase